MILIMTLGCLLKRVFPVLTYKLVRGFTGRIVFCACAMFAHCAFSVGGDLSQQVERDRNRFPHFVVASINDNQIIGQFGGISSAYDVDGDLRSVTLMVLDSGYIAPILDEGVLAGYGVAYFEDDNCTSSEFLPITQSAGGLGLIPKTGFVYGSLATGEIRYLPKDIYPRYIEAKSIYAKKDGSFVCQKKQISIRVIESLKNKKEETGISNSILNRKIVLKRIPFGSPVIGETLRKLETFKGGQSNEVAITSETEVEPYCSPGCPADAIGNNYCDIECLNESCQFDQEDCAEMSSAEIEFEKDKYCAADCLKSEIGDNFCDESCNNYKCDYDGGDCR